MPLQQLKNANFGASLTGRAATISYTILNADGSVNQARTNSGVYEIIANSGIYSANIVFDDNFHGQILWDSGDVLVADRIYAVEHYNVEENDPKVASGWTILTTVTGSLSAINSNVGLLQTDITFIKDIEGGRWKITNNQMVFYKSDGATVVATFNLYDINGTPTMDQVAERQRV
jgi:hypothetical protein